MLGAIWEVTLSDAMIAAKKDSPAFTKNARNCFVYKGIIAVKSNIYINWRLQNNTNKNEIKDFIKAVDVLKIHVFY